MAGVFDTSMLRGPEETPLTVKAGVEGAPSPVEALAPLVKTGFDLFTEKPKEDNTPLTQFSTEQLNIADSVAQGAISPAEGQARMRANVSKYIANNPTEDPNEFFKIQDKIVGTAGLGRVVTTGNKEYQEKEEALKRARDGGYVLPGMTSEEVELGLQLSIQDQVLNRNLQQQTALLQFNSGRVGLTRSEIELQNAQDERNSKNYLNAFVENKRQRINLELSVIKRRAELPAGDPEYLSREDAVQEYSRLKYELQEQLRSIGPHAGGDYLGMAAKPTLDYIDSMTNVTSKGLAKNIADNEYAASLKQMQLGLITEDPKLRTLVALDNLFKNTPINLIKTITDETVEIYTRGSNGDAKEGVAQDLANPNKKQSVSQYLKGVEAYNQAYNAGKYDDASMQQVDNHNESIVKSVANAKNSSAEDLLPLVNYLASPSFGQYVKAKGGLPVGANEANLVLQRQYKEQVLPLIQEKLKEKEVILQKQMPGESPWVGIEQHIDVSFSGDNVSFSVANTNLDPKTTAIIQSEVDSLNKLVAPPLSKLTRIAANFNQSSPQSEWKNLKDRVFLPERVKEPAAPQAPQLHPDDAEWVKAATTLEEKKRRAQVIGVPLDLIEKATRGK
jgi:hypothetical protein